MEKFNRTYLLDIEDADGFFVSIELPFSIEFDIVRNNFSDSNTARIKIYNLKESDRNRIRKSSVDFDVFRTISLQAGYGDNLSQIFFGTIAEAFSYRQGTYFVTEILSNNGYAFVNGTSQLRFSTGDTQAQKIDRLIGDLGKVGIKKGVVGSIANNDTTTRGGSYSGSTMSLLKQLTGNSVFIDNGKVNILSDTECLQGEFTVLESETGLLGTPRAQENILFTDMIFEPRIIVGQLIRLNSSTARNFNSEYKVVSLKHKGMISPTVCGDAITNLGLFALKGLSVVK